MRVQSFFDGCGVVVCYIAINQVDIGRLVRNYVSLTP
jgi:hypothetical protein